MVSFSLYSSSLLLWTCDDLQQFITTTAVPRQIKQNHQNNEKVMGSQVKRGQFQVRRSFKLNLLWEKPNSREFSVKEYFVLI